MSDELKRWARTTELPSPIRWGEIEARILLEPDPSPADREALARVHPERGPVRRVLRWLWLALLLLIPVSLTYGASFIGLGAVVAHTQFDLEPPSGWDIALQVLFGAIIVAAAFPFADGLGRQRRSWTMLVVAGVTSVTSAASFLLLTTGTAATLLGVWGSIQTMALIAAVVGLVSFTFHLVTSKPLPRTRLRERFRSVPLEERWIQSNRAVVLEQLRKRELIDDADSAVVMRLPVGTWNELESLPDGCVGRRL